MRQALSVAVRRCRVLVRFRRLRPASQIGGEFQVNANTSTQYEASVASDSAGDFVVVWTSYRRGRILTSVSSANATTPPVRCGGAQFQVNSYTASFQYDSFGRRWTADGDFVVAWASFGAGRVLRAGSSLDASIRRAPRSGVEFQVNTYTTYRQNRPGGGHGRRRRLRRRLAERRSRMATASGVFAQRFDSAGLALGGELQVNSYTLDVPGTPGGGDG